jgi:hypothetical protein
VAGRLRVREPVRRRRCRGRRPEHGSLGVQPRRRWLGSVRWHQRRRADRLRVLRARGEPVVDRRPRVVPLLVRRLAQRRDDRHQRDVWFVPVRRGRGLRRPHRSRYPRTLRPRSRRPGPRRRPRRPATSRRSRTPTSRSARRSSRAR